MDSPLKTDYICVSKTLIGGHKGDEAVFNGGSLNLMFFFLACGVSFVRQMNSVKHPICKYASGCWNLMELGDCGWLCNFDDLLQLG